MLWFNQPLSLPGTYVGCLIYSWWGFLADYENSGIWGLVGGRGSLGVYLVFSLFLFLYLLSAMRLMTSSTTHSCNLYDLTHHRPGIVGAQEYGEIYETSSKINLSCPILLSQVFCHIYNRAE